MGRKLSLSRRMFLGGAGAAVALPMLRSLLPRPLRADGAAPPPRRILAYYVPNGIHMARWTPATEGPDYELTPILAPLAPVKDKLLVLTGIDNRPGESDGPGDHASGTGSFLTCAHVYKTEGADIRNGVSMDQVAAAHLGQYTRFASLQLGMDGGASTGGCDSGYSCAYTRNISWAGAQSPMPKALEPQIVFDLMFAGFDPDATRAEQEIRRRRKLSVLDSVLDDTASLAPRLGASDRQKLDEYLTGLRDLEVRIADDVAPVCEIGARPPDDAAFPQKLDLMTELMAMAFQCDVTRVISFMLGNAGSGRNYSFIGASGGHHQLSHHQDQQANFDALTVIDTWEVEQLAKLLMRLDAMEEDGGTVLDNTLVFFSSEIEDGNAHRHSNLPIVVAGSGGGAFDTGRHIRYSDGPPMANLFISMLRAVGVQIDRFGDDGNGELPALR